MGLGLSMHTKDGWRGQYDRLRRCYEELRQIRQAMATGKTDRAWDRVLDYFENCYHLRDWLRSSGAVSQEKLDKFIHDHEPMRVCRDLCNSTKHFAISRASIDRTPSFLREYVPSGWPGSRPHVNELWSVVCGEKYDVFDLADTCSRLWDGFLRENQLLSAN